MAMPDFDWTLSYPSSRDGVLAKNVVATSQPLAAQAGLRMMLEGGNAIDAAIATAIALTVIEPTSNGLGSDNFALIWAGGGLHGMNSSGRSPRKLTLDHYQGKDAISTRGWDGVTTPGAVAGWVEASLTHGKLPFAKLFEPAIEYARYGFQVARQTAWYWERGVLAYQDFPEWQKIFAPNGKTPKAGEIFKSEAHARSYEMIAESKGDAFYRGELAEKIVAHSNATGGLLGMDDLAAHETQWVRPIEMEYHGYTLHEIPPNGQGLAALIMLGILKHLPMTDHAVDSAPWVHYQLEAMKLAFRDAHRYIADPAYMDVKVEDLLDDSYLQSRAGLVDHSKAQDFKHGMPKEGGTILLATADAEGNMVSWIQSNYTGFGSGIVVPDTGISIQNRGCCFSLEKGHPNQADGNKKPYHTIIPAFMTKDGAPVMAFGVMGGFMQPQGHAQVMVRVVDYHQNPQTALDGPRWRVDSGMDIALEPEFGEAVIQDLRDRGHHVTVGSPPKEFYGRGQTIYKLDDGYFAGSDGRADGQAVGF